MIRVIQGDCRDVLPTLEAGSVHCCVTSPPYHQLRDYQVAGQIGLEATVEEWIAELVGVFRQVRRVMREDATLWLNCGDAYQDKQLQMLPSRLALALQQPCFTGTIKNEADRIWLAAMIDSEGCMFIHKRKGGTPNYASYTKQDGTTTSYTRLQDTYGSGLEIANTSQAIVERCLAIVGKGSICSQSPDQNNRRKQTIYRWNLRSNECREVVREVYPHLVAKQQQARILIGCPSTGDKAAAAHLAMIALHNGDPTDVDFPEPASMFEPGFYLRSDIIWGKLNPMPESVTDRPTSAHEHVFLLSKRSTYFYDADAVREEAEPSTLERAEAGYGPTFGNKMQQALDRGIYGSGCRLGGYQTSRNLRNVWTIATAPFPEAHFATFPPALAETCIKAGTSERGCCANCGAPWVRQTSVSYTDAGNGNNNMARKGGDYEAAWSARPYEVRKLKDVTTTGWLPGCQCGAGLQPCVVLDPFAGAGTTLLVADRLQRHAIGIELNEAYAAMSRARLTADAPLFAEVAD